MLPRLAALALLALSSGCLRLSYIAQAAAGQDDIAFRSRPIEQVVADPGVPATTRRMLAMIEDVKRFGERNGLTRTSNYRRYADLKREAAVWVVTASQPLRFEPVTWSFPVVGDVPYLGWFDKGDAEQLARSLKAQGYDVYLREASAYSTLGWFDDPVLSTMIDGDDPADLVEVVLHESTHATHFVASQTLFNESLANFVAEQLTPAYLRERLRADRWQLYDWAERQKGHDARVRRMHEAFVALDQLYRSGRSDDDKRAGKREILDRLRRDLGRAGELNNAVLAQAQTYNSGGAAFAALLATCDGDVRRFVAAAKTIGPGDFQVPDQHDIDGVIGARTKAGCPK